MQILQHFDSDHNYPVFGFGGKINNCVNHCFPLSYYLGINNTVELNGIDNIRNAYRAALNSVDL